MSEEVAQPNDQAQNNKDLFDDVFASDFPEENHSEKENLEETEDEKPLKKKKYEESKKEDVEQDKEEEAEPEPEKKVKKQIPQKQLSEDTVEALKEQIKKIERNLTETQKFATKKSQKAKFLERQIIALKDQGSLSEDEAQNVLNQSSFDQEDTLDLVDDKDLPPLQRYYKTANSELSNFKKYNKDPLIDQKIRSFDRFMSEASEEEREMIIDTLDDVADDPVTLLNRMIEHGDDLYHQHYKEVEELGGYKPLINKLKSEIERLKKDLDKNKKKMLQYEDYDDSPVRNIGTFSTSKNVSNEEESDDLFDAVTSKLSRVAVRR